MENRSTSPVNTEIQKLPIRGKPYDWKLGFLTLAVFWTISLASCSPADSHSPVPTATVETRSAWKYPYKALYINPKTGDIVPKFGILFRELDPSGKAKNLTASDCPPYDVQSNQLLELVFCGVSPPYQDMATLDQLNPTPVKMAVPERTPTHQMVTPTP